LLSVGAGNEVAAEQRAHLQGPVRFVVRHLHVEGVEQLDQLLALGLRQHGAQVGHFGEDRFDVLAARLLGLARFQLGDLSCDRLRLPA